MRTRLAALALAAAALARPSAAQPPGTPPETVTAAACGAQAPGAEVAPSLATLIEERRAKCAALQPYRPGLLERQLLAIEEAERPALAQLNVWGFFPRLQTIDHRSQIAVGLRFWRPELKGTPVDLIEIRLADTGLSGRGLSVYQGTLPDIEAAIDIATRYVDQSGGKLRFRIISSPHEALIRQIETSTWFQSRAMPISSSTCCLRFSEDNHSSPWGNFGGDLCMSE